MSKYGPNVTKLITKFIAREAVPPGGGLASAVDFFKDAALRKQVLDSAEAKAIQALQAIKSAPDNPFGDDDERIASELLSKIQERQLTMRAADSGYAPASKPASSDGGAYCTHGNDAILDKNTALCVYCGKPAPLPEWFRDELSKLPRRR